MLHRLRGFTLVELVIVIVLVGILGAVVGPLIGRGYSAIAQSQLRAQRVQQTEFALFHLRQDLQRSVPQSVDVRSNGRIVEFLSLAPSEGGLVARYRNIAPPASSAVAVLSLNEAADTESPLSFDVFTELGPVTVSRAVAIGGSGRIDKDDPNSSLELLIDWNNRTLGTSGAVAVVSSSVIHNESTDPYCETNCAQNPVTRIELSAPTGSLLFRRDSPSYRAYFTTGPVAYECTNQGRLVRHSDYDSTYTFPIAGNANRVLDEVVNCRFSLQPGQATQPPMLTVELGIGDTAESIRLVDTIVLGSAP